MTLDEAIEEELIPVDVGAYVRRPSTPRLAEYLDD